MVALLVIFAWFVHSCFKSFVAAFSMARIAGYLGPAVVSHFARSAFVRWGMSWLESGFGSQTVQLQALDEHNVLWPLAMLTLARTRIQIN